MTGNDVRKKFLDYFKHHGHEVVRSSSLVPQDDPTLLFTNAGMVQFKRLFLGEESRGYNRATTSQKCVRAGGKHNDLENVGYTARHHTFFEMLGNFSFGDYFKEKAIEYGWDLLTNGYGLPEDRLWVSIYLDDDEAHQIWHRNIGVPEEKILRFGEEDNFWAMGDTGPCGPCSEIHLDRGQAYGCGRPDCAVGCDCDRWLEIWNLVFMQFNRDDSGKMTPLPKPSIDTGLGLERMVSILQDVPTNFDIDLIRPIIARTEEISQRPYGASESDDVAMKVIADHSRAAAFLIGDGVFPSNEGRGYVLRRIMRRAIRYGRNIGMNEPFLHRTAEVVFDVMKPAYPELTEARSFITNVIKNEELRFGETLDTGLKLLGDTLANLKAAGKTEVPGAVIFKLYDTYGFPVDIVRDTVREEEIALDMEGFDRAMADQRSRSRSKISFAGISDAYRKLTSKGVQSEFLGHMQLQCESSVLLLVQDGSEVDFAGKGSSVEVVTEQTPFYGEAGGQVGDRGRITADDLDLEVTDTIKDPTGLTIHKGTVRSGRIQKGQTVQLIVDSEKRSATQRNHTATHILHAVLRDVLGDHVKQAGSLVAPDRMRFDFSHFSQIDPETLDRIEALVNEKIRADMPMQTAEMEAEQAFQSGATALFEEKYGDRVRVVSMSDFSKELCGGTHVQRTGEIGLFKIVSESSAASGVRRIEALTGQAALEYTQQATRLLQQAAHLVKDRPETVPARVEKLMADHKTLEKEVERLKAKIAVLSASDAEERIETVDGVKVLAKRVSVGTPAALRDLADQFKNKIGSGVVVLGAVAEGKAMLIAVVTKDLVDRFHAGNIVKDLAAVVGGRGGGRPDMAQAGGPQPENLEQALERVYEILAHA
ncbi:MAG TPA: alanine--tRNA ligase [Desulfobacterales bacterium]